MNTCYDVAADTNGAPIRIVVECPPSPRPVAPSPRAEVSTTTPAPAPPVQVEAGGTPLVWLLMLGVCLVGAAAVHPRTRTQARRALGWPLRASSVGGLLLRSALLLGVLLAATSLLWRARTLLAVVALAALAVPPAPAIFASWPIVGSTRRSAAPGGEDRRARGEDHR